MSTSFSFLSSGPLCMAALDPTNNRVIEINEMFEQTIGPLLKISEFSFSALAQKGNDRQIFSSAIHLANTQGSAKARNIEMLTLAADQPIKKYFDWNIGKAPNGMILLFGDPCSEHDVKQRAKDKELVDYFQNAPIALHWLNGDGIVLWANQRELDILGYTAEEYIGQPMLKFCPDEQELVLEIFKQLENGKTICNVPVRFQAKDGHVVNLLIDSNVKYDVNGKFEHTRCFLHDDTKNKISEAKVQLMLEEMKDSLKILDNFMSRSLNHMRTPLYVLQSILNMVTNNLGRLIGHQGRAGGGNGQTDEIMEEAVTLLQQAGIHIDNAILMMNDISDLLRLDQGGTFKVNEEFILLKDFGKKLLEILPTSIYANVEVALELVGGGSSFIKSDQCILKKVLHHLLEHVMHQTEHGHVTLRIGHQGDQCVFMIIDSGSGIASYELPTGTGPRTNLPPIFQSYHQELLPEEKIDFAHSTNLHDEIEKGINSYRNLGIGIGLSLSYHLVQALGGDLRYSAEPGLTQFWFSIPHSNEELSTERIVRGGLQKRDACRYKGDHGIFPQKAPRREPVISQAVINEQKVTKSNIATYGARANDPPSVLVVEDVNSCAKLLCMSLQQVNCSTKWVENGQAAVDVLKSSADGMYNLVLMDLRMPVMDGLTATKIIKGEMKCAIPVVALTGDIGEETKSQCREIGFDEYCNKPMKRATLISVLERFTGYSPPAAPSKTAK